MKILYIVPYPPSFIRVRPYQLIRHLAQQGHEVTVATLYSNAQEMADIEALRPQVAAVIAEPLPRWRTVWNSVRSLSTGEPIQAHYCWQPALAQALKQLLAQAQFDIIHVEHLRGAEYGLYVQTLTETPIVWDSVDSITYLFEQTMLHSYAWFNRLIARLELARTAAYEQRVSQKWAHIVVTSPLDRASLQGLTTQTVPITVVAMGVDLDYFQVSDKPREPYQLIVSGKMSYHANKTMVLHLLEKIMPLVWAKMPEVSVMVVGKDPPAAVRHWASHPQVTVTGMVPSMRPYLQTAAVAVCPLTYGAGIQNKVLEAMACGTPVIASSSATAALGTTADQDILVADDVQLFAHKIVKLLKDPERQRQLGLAGRRYVEKEHQWQTIGGHLEKVYDELI